MPAAQAFVAHTPRFIAAKEKLNSPARKRFELRHNIVRRDCAKHAGWSYIIADIVTSQILDHPGGGVQFTTLIVETTLFVTSFFEIWNDDFIFFNFDFRFFLRWNDFYLFLLDKVIVLFHEWNRGRNIIINFFSE